jgi:hypothetical protein
MAIKKYITNKKTGQSLEVTAQNIKQVEAEYKKNPSLYQMEQEEVPDTKVLSKEDDQKAFTLRAQGKVLADEANRRAELGGMTSATAGTPYRVSAPETDIGRRTVGTFLDLMTAPGRTVRGAYNALTGSEEEGTALDRFNQGASVRGDQDYVAGSPALSSPASTASFLGNAMLGGKGGKGMSNLAKNTGLNFLGGVLGSTLGQGAQGIENYVTGGTSEDQSIGDRTQQALTEGGLSSMFGLGAKGLGEAGKAVGGKLITSTVKPKIGGSFNVDDLMSAKNVDGSNVIKPFSGVSGAVSDVYKALGQWSEQQAKSIPNAQVNILPKLADLKDEYYQKLLRSEITTGEYDKVVGVLNDEADRFAVGGIQAGQGGFLAVNAPYQNVHNAKVDVGGKGRYDLANPNNSVEPIQRSAFRDLYTTYSDVLGGAQGNPAYKEATLGMRPLMGSKKYLEQADERIGKNNLIPLTSMMAGSAVGGATQDLKLMLAGALVPWLTQGMRTGTGMYRGGEALASPLIANGLRAIIAGQTFKGE